MSAKRLFLVAVTFSLAFFGLTSVKAWALDKLNFGTPIKASALYDLPSIAAEEKGFWKQNGLETQWFSFEGGPALHKAVAAGSIDMGIASALSPLQAIVGGVPEIFVGDMQAREDFYIFVRADSRLKDARDLKGAKIGITRLGGAAHAYGRMLAKTLGFEKELKFVAVGGIRQQIAGLTAGTEDGELLSLITFAPLVARGEVRILVAIRDYLPKEWADVMIFARKEVTEKSPDVVKRAVKAIVQAGDYVAKNPDWAMEKMKVSLGHAPEVAKLVYSELQYGKDGRISRAGLQNIVNFLIEYGIVPKEKMPSLDKLHTTAFTE